jgi:hypothetical protein
MQAALILPRLPTWPSRREIHIDEQGYMFGRDGVHFISAPQSLEGGEEAYDAVIGGANCANLLAWSTRAISGARTRQPGTAAG